MMKLARPRLAAMILCATGLTACGEERPRIALPPAELAECATEPAAPELPAQDWTSVDTARAIQGVRDRLALDYILGLRTWGGDCAADVAGLAAWRETAGR